MGRAARSWTLGVGIAGVLAFALIATGETKPDGGSEGGVLVGTMSDTPPASQSQAKPAASGEPVRPAKQTSSTPPAPPSDAVHKPAPAAAPVNPSAPAVPAAGDKPAVFPYRLQRPLAPRNAKGEKDVTFPLGLYDETVDARTEVTNACQKARKENKRVLVIFGENYCGFCAWLHDTLVEDARIKGMLESDYVTVFADLGKPPWSKNLDLALEFGLDLNQTGAPAMAILEAATERPLQSLPSKDVLAKPMTTMRVFDAEPIVRYLTASRVPQSSVQELIGTAQRQAATDHKRVMLCFVSSRSERSTKFRRWISGVEVATMLERDLIVRSIDVDRVDGAGQQLVLYAGPAVTADNLPWYIVMEPGGKLVVDSNEKGRNLGMPSTDDEIAAMVAKLAKACPSLNSADRELLAENLKASRTDKAE